MNRIILIGNGFDLAHGLKTSYKDFIADFLSSKGEEIKKNERGHECEFFKIDRSLYSIYDDLKTYGDYKKLFSNNTNKFKIKNKFFWEVITKNGLEDWVDIENEYYQRLKIISQLSKDEHPAEQLRDLNKDLEQIKIKLKDYLIDEMQSSDKVTLKNRGIDNLIKENISLNDLEQSVSKSIFKTIYEKLDDFKSNISEPFLYVDKSFSDLEGKKPSVEEFYRFMSQAQNADDYIKLKAENLLMLSFNYTDTHLNYSNFNYSGTGYKLNISELQIHGSLEDKNNPIIFGFGDELDKDYQTIEDLDDNDYLENIKSIKYLETDNYRKLLEFAESDQFQIYILGHSCGNSDRTLLNTLFEHENCVSIKPFYHKREDGTDNYSDIVRNISRNFTSKAKMRERVVNKTYTSPIPKRVN